MTATSSWQGPNGALSNGIRRSEEGGVLRLDAFGVWTVATAAFIDRQLQQVTAAVSGRLDTAVCHLHLAEIERLDTAGAWLLNKLAADLKQKGCALVLGRASPEHQSLLQEIARHAARTPDLSPRPNPLSAALTGASGAARSMLNDFTGLIGFLGASISAILSTLTFRTKFRWTAFVHHLDHAGLRAAPIIALICFLVGAVVMQQGALQLATYGAEPYAAGMLGVLALREVGVLLTAVMVAGRSASAFTAEIGSMKMREEIDAMRTLGIEPISTLVLPRILALLVALPLLTFVGDIMCLAGGAAVAVFYLDQSLPTFLDRLREAIEFRHFLAGMIKTPFAALVIGLVGCSEGLKVAGSAESLGQHVTSSVVKSIFLVIILGALFAMFLVSIGI